MAKVEFRFEAESLDAAGHEIYRLGEAAEAAGFELIAGEVRPAPPEEQGGPSYYDPITPPPE